MTRRLSESAFVGAGIGAALGGMRPIVEVMTVNFSLLALDQILNNAATLRYMSGGQLSVPLVIRMATGAGRQVAAQHSHSLEGWYAHIPGLRVLAPATIEDARGMLQPALDDPDPVIIFEHAGLYNEKGDIPDELGAVAIEGAAVRREGQDVTLVAYGGTLRVALGAAEELAAAGVSAEVVDLRCLRPLDSATVAASVTKTHRVVVLDEGWRTGSLSAEVAQPHQRGLLLRPRRAGRSRVHGRGPHPLCQAPRGCGLAPGGRCRRRRAPVGRLMGDFRMPSLGADMEAGRVTEWLVKVGDEVKRGDIVAVVETEKSTIEVEIFESGVIEAIVVPVGEEVPVGTVLARVRSGAPGPSEVPHLEPPASSETASQVGREAATTVTPVVRSPVVRHLAAESGIDLQAITGTGEGGVITRHDVEQAVAARAAPDRSGARFSMGPPGRRRAGHRPRHGPRDRPKGGGDRGRRPEGRCIPNSTGRDTERTGRNDRRG